MAFNFADRSLLLNMAMVVNMAMFEVYFFDLDFDFGFDLQAIGGLLLNGGRAGSRTLSASFPDGPLSYKPLPINSLAHSSALASTSTVCLCPHGRLSL